MNSTLLPFFDYKRYGRQMILEGFGLTGPIFTFVIQVELTRIYTTGQLKLRQSAVIVIGAGGLGCPALQYLAAAGVGHCQLRHTISTSITNFYTSGKIAIVDHDIVDISNLQRQILHKEARVGTSKVHSAEIAIKECSFYLFITTFQTLIFPQG